LNAPPNDAGNDSKKRSRRVAIYALVLLLAANGTAVPAAAQEARWLISFETLSSLSPAPPNIGDRPYGERAAVTREAVEIVLPSVLTWAGRVSPLTDRLEGPAITPGGYRLKTSPSVQLVLRSTVDEATRLGAALGFVFRQWAVMISNADARRILGDRRRHVGLVRIEIAGRPIDADLAHRFFLHAAATDKGLGLGYTSFGSALLYLNIRDATGTPFSGMNDLGFTERLKAAAASFTLDSLRVLPPIDVDAWFVENDWAKAPNGNQYARLFGDDLQKAQAKLLQGRADALLRDAARRYGWR